MSAESKFCLLLTSFVLFIGIFWIDETVEAKEEDWYLYENAHFEVYSDASEKRVRKLLVELEDFRAASTQVMTVKVPEDADKTQLIVFASKRDFQEVVANRRIAAFVTVVDNVPYMVMPVGKLSGQAGHLIRHEYVHVLFSYTDTRYPLWYQEGFAEFMSGTRITGRGTKFTYGDEIPRIQVGDNLVPWNVLVSDEFDVHSMNSARNASNAYYQSWLLVHYLKVGERGAHEAMLSRYLGRVAVGESSVEAMTAEFGMSPNDFGSRVFGQYRRRMPYYEIDFAPGMQDHMFDRSLADYKNVQTILDKIKRRRSSDEDDSE